MPKKAKAKSSLGSMLKTDSNVGILPWIERDLVYPVTVTDTAASSESIYQFKINSLNDPDYTGIGSQPTCFDQYMALYRLYRVLAVEVDLEAFDQTTVGGYTRVCALPGLEPSPASFSWLGFVGGRDAVLGYAAANGVSRLRHVIPLEQVYGVNRQSLLAEDSYAAIASASPTTAAYLSLVVWAGGGATNVIRFVGRLKFRARFEQPVNNNVSLARVIRPAIDRTLAERATRTPSAELDEALRKYREAKTAAAAAADVPQAP
jgi:hypothetical protein